MIHVFKEYEHCCSNLTQTQLYTVQCKPIVFETQNIVLSCTILSYIVSAVDLCFNLVVILCKKKKAILIGYYNLFLPQYRWLFSLQVTCFVV